MHSRLLDKMVSMDKLFDEWKRAHGAIPSKYAHPFQHCAFKQFNAMTYMVPVRNSSYPKILSDIGKPIDRVEIAPHFGTNDPVVKPDPSGPKAFANPNVMKIPNRVPFIPRDSSLGDAMLFW